MTDTPAPFPASPAQRRAALAGIRIVASDVDGTLTTGGALTATVVEAIERLASAGVELIPVSGRATGEVAGLVRYLPGVGRGLAENGQVLVEPDRPLRWLVPRSDRTRLESVAHEVAQALGEELELAPDHYCRVGDLAFERAARADEELARFAAEATKRGAHVVWSSVHVHFSFSAPDKGAQLLSVLAGEGTDPASVLTMGDAPNDAGLFFPKRFGISVGTADVLAHRGYLAHEPRYVCAQREGAAFVEVAEALIEARRSLSPRAR